MHRRENDDMTWLLEQLKWLANHPNLSAEDRAYYRSLYEAGLYAEDRFYDWIEEVESLSIRNPAFPGDMVGWLDDDFDDDFDDDDDDKADSEGDQKR